MLYVEHLEINRVCITHINKSINSPIFQAVGVEGSTKLCVLMHSFCFFFSKFMNLTYTQFIASITLRLYCTIDNLLIFTLCLTASHGRFPFLVIPLGPQDCFTPVLSPWPRGPLEASPVPWVSTERGKPETRARDVFWAQPGCGMGLEREAIRGPQN